MAKETKIYVRVDMELKVALSRAAKEEGVSDSEYVRRAIKEKLRGASNVSVLG